VEEYAPAKVNLYLHVLGRRPDGYHLLDSLAVFPGAADRLRAEPATGLSIDVTGPFAPLLAAEPDNLVLRAARALREQAAGLVGGARLVLEKHLPVASGLGGGSADAAAALRLLSRLWGLETPADRMQSLARGLGADVPVCLQSRPTRMQGIGEKLRPAPALPPHAWVLVNPGIAVSTPAIFRARQGEFSLPAVLPAGWADAVAMAADLAGLTNDLEQPAIAICPQITDVLAALRAQPGCLLARMSGSGATCFGLFASPQPAAAAAARLRRPGWWSWSGSAS
jgi:4-diphosphocytidyl-2-C-methyl-D-erythritol kinase